MTDPPPMPLIVGRVDSRTGQPATVETPREWLAADEGGEGDE